MKEFLAVFQKYEAMIHHILRSLRIYKNYDEFFQIGLIALWEAKERFDSKKGSFTSFAYLTIKGRLLTELKKSAALEERYRYPKEEFWNLQLDEGADVPLEMETLLTYCEGLTTNQKKWVVATFHLGMSSAELANYENVSPSAVKKWKRGALEKIKQKLGR
ncbi:sigma-70 family RNA polymerase sigma factor [Heyndrickxia camelliae]|uniref:RNA polymerase subunit sigma-24 n=1 Tax=Heyndrickxia camelliae TaxID=1707093 RepID=A0A2N3LPG6_9BACI|nr:sigma-70 family RNA polymerase sigma factor [Heyndrickxia camelliae]PKR86467.1 RNA polymerase subunit sigma-24 [Heyndrickxia camelliae]